MPCILVWLIGTKQQPLNPCNKPVSGIPFYLPVSLQTSPPPFLCAYKQVTFMRKIVSTATGTGNLDSSAPGASTSSSFSPGQMKSPSPSPIGRISLPSLAPSGAPIRSPPPPVLSAPAPRAHFPLSQNSETVQWLVPRSQKTRSRVRICMCLMLFHFFLCSFCSSSFCLLQNCQMH